MADTSQASSSPVKRLASLSTEEAVHDIAHGDDPDPHDMYPHAQLHHGVEKDSFKHRLGEALESRRAELIILAFVIFEVCLVTLECGVDYHILCVRGRLVPMGPDPLYSMAIAHHDKMAAHAPSVGGEHNAGGHSHDAHLTQVMSPGQAAASYLYDNVQSEPGSFVPSPAVLFQVAFDAFTNMGTLATAHVEGVSEARAASSSEFNPEQLDALRQAILHPGIGHHGPASLLCEDHHGPRAKFIEDICFYLSTTILCGFLLELTLKIYVNPSHFFASSMHVSDLFVVVISLFVQVILVRLLGRYGYFGEMIVSLLVLCRLWRIVRIVHTFFLVGHNYHKRAKHIRKQHEKLSSHLTQALEKVALYEAYHQQKGMRTPVHHGDWSDDEAADGESESSASPRDRESSGRIR